MIIKQILIVFLLLNLSQCILSELVSKGISNIVEGVCYSLGRATGDKIADAVYGDNKK